MPALSLWPWIIFLSLFGLDGRRCDRRRFGGPWSSRGGDGRDTESRRSTSDGVSINKSQWSLVKAESSAAPAQFQRLRVAGVVSESRRDD